MRKTIILAFATAILGVVSIVTDLTRTNAVPSLAASNLAAQVQTTGVLKVKTFDSI
jgi:formate-dependent nitrite reductase membrane component NrfD